MTKINYEELASSVETMREVLRAMVAGLMADGYTEEQARAIVTSVVTKQDDDDE